MSRKIIVELSRSEKRQLRIWIQREAEAGLRTRMSIILHLARGRPAAEAADALHVAITPGDGDVRLLTASGSGERGTALFEAWCAMTEPA